MTCSDVVRVSLADYFRMVQTQIQKLVAPLSSDQLWRKPYSYGNSIGNLVLHLTGNLNYYIGAQIAGTGYIRHRDEEFTHGGKSKADLMRDFDVATEMVLSTIARQTDADWVSPYSAVNEPESENRFTAVFRCAGHAYHHVRQIIYLQRELLKDQ